MNEDEALEILANHSSGSEFDPITMSLALGLLPNVLYALGNANFIPAAAAAAGAAGAAGAAAPAAAAAAAAGAGLLVKPVIMAATTAASTVATTGGIVAVG